MRESFFEKRIGKDLNIVKVVLLLTGALHGTKNQVREYLQGFRKYDWLWKDDMDQAYKKFIALHPSLEDYEMELKRFKAIEQEIELIAPMHNIGALSLCTRNLKLQLMHEGSQWKVLYSDKLHYEAMTRMEELSDYIKNAMKRLNREVTNLNTLRLVMDELKEIREKEAGIEMEIGPVMDMYKMLESYLPPSYMGKEEMDKRSVLRSSWRKLVDYAEEVTDKLGLLQVQFKRKLVKDVQTFYVDVIQFRADYLSNGPMVPQIPPMDAVERLHRYKEEYLIRERKFELYQSGEELFALKKTDYPELAKTKQELSLLDRLYGLYVDVLETGKAWREILWMDVKDQIDDMGAKIEKFAADCKRMPSRLRDWQAYKDLQQTIIDFQTVLPLMLELSKPAIKTRHWGEVMKVTGKTFNVDGAELKLQTLLDAKLENYKDEIDEITDSAEKQQSIEIKLVEI
jgi:dynein heavy chain